MPTRASDHDGVVARLVERVRPNGAPRAVTLAGAGLDNVAYDVDGELIVRLRREPAPGQVTTEARILARADACAPPAVPRALLVDEEAGALVYPRLPGTPLADLHGRFDELDLDRFGATIGAFLTRLHDLPAEAYEGFAQHDPPDPPAWLALARREYARLREHVPVEAHGAIAAFLAIAPPAANPAASTLCHNDLGIEHVLVDPGTLEVTAIIDWTDAAVADPAYDLGLVHRDLGEPALDAVLRRYGAAREPLADLRARAAFYARASLFEDLAYALRPGHETRLAHVHATLRGMFSR